MRPVSAILHNQWFRGYETSADKCGVKLCHRNLYRNPSPVKSYTTRNGELSAPAAGLKEWGGGYLFNSRHKTVKHFKSKLTPFFV